MGRRNDGSDYGECQDHSTEVGHGPFPLSQERHRFPGHARVCRNAPWASSPFKAQLAPAAAGLAHAPTARPEPSSHCGRELSDNRVAASMPGPPVAVE